MPCTKCWTRWWPFDRISCLRPFSLSLSLARTHTQTHTLTLTLTLAETGGCPHAAIREDISGNLVKLEELTEKFHPEVPTLQSEKLIDGYLLGDLLSNVDCFLGEGWPNFDFRLAF